MQAGVVPGYRELLARGELGERVGAARKLLESCTLCPRRCKVNRREGKLGKCRTGAEAVVSSYGPHFGEERPLVGRGGSGTIFLTNCNLECIFCQNYDISQAGRMGTLRLRSGQAVPELRDSPPVMQGQGEQVSVSALAGMMLSLQQRGCHNINWVTPTHQMPQLLAALEVAAEQGLARPVVYNCGGYESLEALRLLAGVVDIYMPDAKYGSNESGERLSGVPDYWDRCQEALAEMHRQVGDLVIDEGGLARRGLLVRHLVLPEELAATRTVMRFLAGLSRDTYVNVMAQYRPAHRAGEAAELARPLRRPEYQQALAWAEEAGLHRLEGR